VSEGSGQRQVMAAETLLQVIGVTLKRVPNLRLETLIIFLAVCVNEGIGVKDLVYICGLSDSMVSRAVDSLCRTESGELLAVVRHATDGRRRLVYLSENGRALAQEVEALLGIS